MPFFKLKKIYTTNSHQSPCMRLILTTYVYTVCLLKKKCELVFKIVTVHAD